MCLSAIKVAPITSLLTPSAKQQRNLIFILIALFTLGSLSKLSAQPYKNAVDLEIGGSLFSYGINYERDIWDKSNKGISLGIGGMFYPYTNFLLEQGKNIKGVNFSPAFHWQWNKNRLETGINYALFLYTYTTIHKDYPANRQVFSASVGYRRYFSGDRLFLNFSGLLCYPLKDWTNPDGSRASDAYVPIYPWASIGFGFCF